METKLYEENHFLKELLKKYDYILAIYITGEDGSIITSEIQSELPEKLALSEETPIALAIDFNMSLEQILKTEKWKTQSIITFFENRVIFQNKINKVSYCHIICKENEYSHETIKNVIKLIKSHVDKIEDKLENLINEGDKN